MNFIKSVIRLLALSLVWAAFGGVPVSAYHQFKQKVGDVVYFVWPTGNTIEVKRFNLATESWQSSFAVSSSVSAMGVDGDNIYLAHYNQVWRRNLDGSGDVLIFTATSNVIGLLTDTLYLFVVEERQFATVVTSIRKTDLVKVSTQSLPAYFRGFSISGPIRKIYAKSKQLLELSYNADGTFGSTLYKDSLRGSGTRDFTIALPSATKVLRGDSPEGYSTNGLDTYYDLPFRFTDIDFVSGDEGVCFADDWIFALDSNQKVVGAKPVVSTSAVAQRNGVIYCFKNGGEPVEKLNRSDIISLGSSPNIGGSQAPVYLFGLFIFGVGGDKAIVIAPGQSSAFLYSLSSRSVLASLKLLSNPVGACYSPDANRVYIAYRIPGIVTALGNDAATFKETLFTSAPNAIDSVTAAGEYLVLASTQGAPTTHDIVGNLVEVNSGVSYPANFGWVWLKTARSLINPSSSYLTKVALDGTLSTPVVLSLSGSWGVRFLAVDAAESSLVISNGTVVSSTTYEPKGVLPFEIADADFSGGELRTIRSVGGSTVLNTWSSSYSVQKSLNVRGTPIRMLPLPDGSYAVFSEYNYALEITNVSLSTGVVGAAPVLTEWPSSKYVSEGQPVSFSVAVDALSGPVTYQWFKDGAEIPGAISNTFLISSAKGSDIGKYSVRVSNAYGSVKTEAVSLGVDVPSGIPTIIDHSKLIQAVEGSSASLFVTAEGQNLSYSWFKYSFGDSILVSNSSFFVIPSVKKSDEGVYRCIVTNGKPGFAATGLVELKVSPAPTGSGAITISSAPADQSVAQGAAFTLSVSASGNGLTYSWTRNGISLGTTSSSLTVTNAKESDAGVYEVTVASAGGGLAKRAATVTVKVKDTTTVAPKAAVTNISTRMFVDSGSNIAVAGFVVTGKSAKRILIRASGPALSPFVGAGAMTDPRLRVFDSKETLINSNDDWDSANENDFKTAGAFGWSKNSKDAAVVLTLSPGSYTAQVSIQSGASGTALVEVYDLETGSATYLSNISTRALVKTGSDIAIAGFAVTGEGSKQVLIRGAGPALTQFGLTAVLADPKISVLDSNGTKVAENSSWGSDLEATFTQAGAFAWTKGSKDAALVATLQPGNYTVHLQGEDGGSGVAIVEVYELK